MNFKNLIKNIKKAFVNNSTYAGIAIVLSIYFLGKASKA